MTNGKCKCLADVSRCDEKEEEASCVCCRAVVCHADGREEGGHQKLAFRRCINKTCDMSTLRKSNFFRKVPAD